MVHKMGTFIINEQGQKVNRKDIALNLFLSLLLILGGAAMVWGGYGMVM